MLTGNYVEDIADLIKPLAFADGDRVSLRSLRPYEAVLLRVTAPEQR